jgi:hypothetical protein
MSRTELSVDKANNKSFAVIALNVMPLAPLPKTKEELLSQAKTLIAAGERSLHAGMQCLHDAAEALAIAKEEFHATQREIAQFVGKSPAWVNALLKWRLRGYKGKSPFGPTTKQGRVQHAEQRAISKPRKTLPAKAKNATVMEDPFTTRIAADDKNDNTTAPPAGLIAVDGKNDNTTATPTGLIAADSKNDNTTEASTTGIAADSKNDNTTEAPRADASRPDYDASATALIGFKLAVDQWVPRMNYADRCDATSYLLKKAKVSVS